MHNILIIDNLHKKNVIGLKLLLNEDNYTYKFGNYNDIENYDIIYSPGYPIDTSKYPNKKFIFGPHFSIFPNGKLNSINNIHKNSIYIQPSEWCVNKWIAKGVLNYLPITSFPFPVEINRFCPSENKIKDKVFVYFKRRQTEELDFIIDFLNKHNISYNLFNYKTGYNENNYLNYLQQSKYGIILGAHESQGFAIEEALSCNVPLLVWNTKYMSQEKGSGYPNIPCNTISYWDERCGEYFYEAHEFENTFNKFINNIDTYKPREYILDNLSPKKCSERFNKLINCI